MTTQSSSKQEKFHLVQNFNMTWSIIEVKAAMTWEVVAGPYMTKEEALPDFRNILNENRNNI